MTYKKAIKIVGAKAYSDCSVSEKQEMDCAIKWLDENPQCFPKGTFIRDRYEFRKAFENLKIEFCKLFYIDKIVSWIRKV
jgi:hypothetical protein